MRCSSNHSSEIQVDWWYRNRSYCSGTLIKSARHIQTVHCYCVIQNIPSLHEDCGEFCEWDQDIPNDNSLPGLGGIIRHNGIVGSSYGITNLIGPVGLIGRNGLILSGFAGHNSLIKLIKLIIDTTATSLQWVYSQLIGQILQTYYSILEYNAYLRRNSVQAKKS